MNVPPLRTVREDVQTIILNPMTLIGVACGKDIKKL